MIDIISNNYFIQAIGLVASSLSIIAFNQKDDTRLKLLIGFAGLIAGLHFYLLGSLFGAIAATLAGTRFLLSIYKKFDFLLPVFLLFYIGLAFKNDGEFIHYLPLVAGFLGTLAVFSFSGNRMRSLLLICQLCWLTHNVFFMSIGGIIEQTFQIIMNVRTMVRIKKND